MTVQIPSCDYCGLPIPGAMRQAEWLSSGPQYCCFGCRFADSITRERDDDTTSRWTLTRLGLSIFFAMNVMVFTMARWSNDIYGSDGSEFSNSLHALFRYLCLLFTLPVLGMLGAPLLNHAVQGLKRRRLTSELLIVAGVFAAFAFSTVSVFRDSGHTYFEVACMVLVLVTLGRWFEASGRARASMAISRLQRLLPETASRLVDGAEESISLDALACGDRIRLRAGERVPVDGELVSGRTTVDEQIFTGESIPVEKGLRDHVLAGTVNLDGDIVILATAAPRQGSFGRLLKILQAARKSRSRYEKLADRVAQWFVPAAALIAGAALVGHWNNGVLPALMAALSVVLIACPCALGLATPLAVWTSLAHAASRHVLFRNGESLERLAGIRAVRFDKTGTLTDGSPYVKTIVIDDDTERNDLLSIAWQVSSSSNHVFSQAITRALDAPPECVQLRDIHTVPGSGIRATGQIAGYSAFDVKLGSAAFVCADGTLIPQSIEFALRDSRTSDAAVVLIAWQNRVRALFGIGEQLRPESEAAIAACRDLGIDTGVLTGDRAERASHWGDALGTPVVGGLSPEEKLHHIRTAREALGAVAMVGDGINDAPALAAADVGVALGCGADVSRDSADVCIISNDLSRVPWSIELARQTRRVVRQNLAWAFGYNTGGIALAALGLLNPAIAAGLMLASSAFVIINSMRLAGSDGRAVAPIQSDIEVDRNSGVGEREDDTQSAVMLRKPW